MKVSKLIAAMKHRSFTKYYIRLHDAGEFDLCDISY